MQGVRSESLLLLSIETFPTMLIKIVNHSSNPLPSYETTASAGMDLRANLQSPMVLHPMQRALVPTGLFIELPLGYEAQVRPRSGLAIKNGITVLNSPGTIDADYRGEIKVVLINLSGESFTINNGDRIAQMIIAQHEQANWEQTEELTETKRGSGGFGHTGK
jgi:dUTP pyrophosphatase